MINLFIYNIAVRCYYLLIYASSFFNPKAKKWIEGRKNIFDQIRSKVHVNENYIWFHCASAGEFEQGRPLIDAIQEQFPQYKTVLTFFSPSGYELRKNFDGVNHVFYLPLDTPANAALFIKLINPKLALFVKYEFWLNYLAELERKKIPAVLVSAKFRKEQIFFRSYGSIFLKALKSFRILFVQEEESKKLLAQYGVDNVIVAGDTRFDRVISIASAPKPLPLIEKFLSGSKDVFVAGSTWKQDEEVITPSINNDSSGYKWIIVPHEVDANHIKQLQSLFSKPYILYSELENGKELSGVPILIVDKVGLLSSIYNYAKITYVGGGFGKGIHNTLEAAVYGKPVLFGPHYTKFTEAVELINCKAAFTINNADEFEKCFNSLRSEGDLYNTAAHNAAEYVKQNAGGTTKIVNELVKEKLL